MLLSSGHKIHEILQSTQVVSSNPPCAYKSRDDSAYEELLEALKPYGTLGKDGPHVGMKRSDLQSQYAEHRRAHDPHLAWMADVVRLVLRPGNLRRLVDVVHYQWKGELGNVNYCA